MAESVKQIVEVGLHKIKMTADNARRCGAVKRQCEPCCDAPFCSSDWCPQVHKNSRYHMQLVSYWTIPKGVVMDYGSLGY